MMTLRETLDLVPDFRSSQGRRHSLGAILALATCAMLCGARSLYAIAQWGRDQGGATAQLLGFSQEKTPCVATLHRVFKGLDVAAFEAEVGNWLANSGVEADDPLSRPRSGAGVSTKVGPTAKVGGKSSPRGGGVGVGFTQAKRMLTNRKRIGLSSLFMFPSAPLTHLLGRSGVG